ncbi:RelA/SpoT family protein [Thermotoga neapolitana]|jgi:GTP pyrophosphokinase|uniref:(P)ppGpp synthetase n=1 Tax=Thermotoga neapolitana (strain ATCC 49049 / DSM 4359 / NBRC 107923 / NS-E) TaxID=309803 RepID=B9KAP8_THENN|nr:bifunctional (p)ppGpp synthetase/guanosine-3',5'-bis(diphosphate) 3'-pyrophosphohydrolase [Thermotoga neapolitana]ACM24031.1 (P)ppGpp synthetase [Thermotoga neapolitana DSM 4359]KFZ20823.1 (P)ppGpp synthetase [Thermotoga neapolitana LA10]MDK2785528.1 diphosphokinase / guanosine-3,5-bis(diphosphate) 3-diphosphatase [Thermotoga sp.]HBF10923.1 bifunctional (p)ppGpp synthetase/guanosine-3',5'-bis(diphosphate) 3'-pyrophosphohydrolase [Thermotoga neapolitana]
MLNRIELESEARAVVRELESLRKKNFSREEKRLLMKAYEFAWIVHEGQKRFSGDPFISHPVEVAKILAELGVDSTTLAAALLHDTIEDGEGVSLDQIKELFGNEIARIVDGVTKVSSINAPVGPDQDSRKRMETIQKMFLAMAEDMRVIFVKLADRLHNMRTIQYVQDPEKKKYKAYETLEVYAPLAHKLGIYSIKSELEDLAFKVLYPEEYYRIKELVAEKKKEREKRTNEYISILKSALEEHRIKATVEGRYKHYYSIWRKMKEKGKKFEEIYDLIALRVVVKDVTTCYTVLGIVHNIWKPLPGRFKDYIAAPKSNGYRSLHTTVITGYGEPLEIQIRDEEMHREAEYGLIAHWIYKEKPDVKTAKEWIERLLDWRKELAQGFTEFEDIKKELQMDEVFVFTPKGDIIHLPKGATPIDFAYAIHTEVGHHYSGAKVNGKIVPIDYQLKNGDVVEIIVNKNSSGPSVDWLKYARTHNARAKIRRFLKEKLAPELVEKGKETLRRICRKLGKSFEEVMQSDGIKRYLNSYPERDFFMKIGEGSITTQDLIEAILGKKIVVKRKTKKKKAQSQNIVTVDGIESIEFHIARCCHPIKGDPIVAVVSKRGMSIHRSDCKNLKGISQEKIFPAEWNLEASEMFDAYVRVVLDSEKSLPSLIDRVTNLGAEFVGVKTLKDRNPILVQLHIRISNTGELNEFLSRLKAYRYVLDAERVIQ